MKSSLQVNSSKWWGLKKNSKLWKESLEFYTLRTVIAPIITKAVIGHRVLGQWGTAPKTQFSNNYWQKKGTEKNKEEHIKNSWHSSQVSFKTSNIWLGSCGQVGLGWSPRYLCSLSKVQRVTQWVSEKVSRKLLTQAWYQPQASGLREDMME